MQRDSEGWDKKPMNEHSKLGSIISSTHRNHGNGFGVSLLRSSLRPPDQCLHNPLKLHDQANVHGVRTSESTRLEKTATIPTTEGELSCAECSNLVSAQRKTHGATAPRMATEDINAPNAYQSYMAPSNVSQKDRNSRETTTVRKAVERARSDTRKRNQCMRIQECE
jgi:hypothetical protein